MTAVTAFSGRLSESENVSLAEFDAQFVLTQLGEFRKGCMSAEDGVLFE